MVAERKPDSQTAPERNGGPDPHLARAHPLLIATLVLGVGYLIQKVIGKREALPPDRSERAPVMSRRRGHELRDASVGWVFGIVGILGVSIIAIHFALAGMMSILRNKPTPGDQWQPIARRGGVVASPLPTYPRLQVSPPLDLAAFKASEDKQLNSYGWVNQTSGIVHIPIGLAMELTLKRGLPVREQQREPGESSYQLQLKRVEQRGQQKENLP